MLHAHQIWAGNMPEADDAVARVGKYLRQIFVSLSNERKLHE
jgi:hypothetical protein